MLIVSTRDELYAKNISRKKNNKNENEMSLNSKVC